MRSFRNTGWCLPVRSVPILVAGLLMAVPALACDAPRNTVDAAIQARDLDRAIEAVRQARLDPACSGAPARLLGRRVALLHLAIANQRIGAGTPRQQIEALLSSALAYGEPWQILAQLGDYAREARNFAAATVYYQRALNDMADTSTGAVDPPVAQIERIRALAEQTNLIAPQTAAVVTRNHQPGGIDLPNVRNVVVKRVARPIQFNYDREDLTDQGQQQAQLMFQILRDQQFPAIRLIGHTDMAGSDDYNQKLSDRRAQYLKRYLIQMGYEAGKISTEGRGKSDPLHIRDRDDYTPEQIAQMLRRVEYERVNR